MKYIESLREGERINEIYLCKVKQSALTKDFLSQKNNTVVQQS